MNIIRKGAELIIKSWIIKCFEAAEIASDLGMDVSLDDICEEEGTTQKYIDGYEQAGNVAETASVKDLIRVYFALAPLTACLAILIKIQRFEMKWG